MMVKFEKRIGPWGISKPFKKSKIWRKLSGTLIGKKTELAAQLNGDLSIKAKTLAFTSFMERQESKLYPLSSKTI